MRTGSLKKTITGTLLASAVAFSGVALTLSGVNQPRAASATGTPYLEVTSDPEKLSQNNAHREFTVTVEMKGVDSTLPGGGVFGAEIALVPVSMWVDGVETKFAEITGTTINVIGAGASTTLDFVSLVPSTTEGIVQSTTTSYSREDYGEYVAFDTGRGGAAITSDFIVAGYTFKLKDSVTTIPDRLVFQCVDISSAYMAPVLVGAATVELTVEFVAVSDRFELTSAAAANHPYNFRHVDSAGTITDAGNVEDVAYDTANPLYMNKLSPNDTLQTLLNQFENNETIKVYAQDGVTEITDYTQKLTTGMVLKIVDGTDVLNELTISVLGDINGDGRINTFDKSALNAHTIDRSADKHNTLKGAALLAGDINGDGRINTFDKSALNAHTIDRTPDKQYDIHKLLTLTAAAATSLSAEATELPTGGKMI